jgi:hypothetical protein
MPIYSQKELADLVGVQHKHISQEFKRGKIIYTAEKKIDSDHPINALYISKKTGKVDTKTTKSDFAVQPSNKPSIESSNPLAGLSMSPFSRKAKIEEQNSKNANLFDQEREREKIEIEKLKHDTRYSKIKADKAEGIVIPSELISPVVKRHNQNILNSIKNANEEILTEYGTVKEFNTAEIAAMRGYIFDALNKAFHNATLETTKSISGIIADYSERRGVGERA